MTSKSKSPPAKNPGGRPLKFKDPQELQDKINMYFEICKENQEPLTKSGFALGLGFSAFEDVENYKKKGKFSEVIKRACTLIEKSWESKLAKQTCTGAIFWLKNAGWRDQQDLKVSADRPFIMIKGRRK